jgi:hypothetical protein
MLEIRFMGADSNCGRKWRLPGEGLIRQSGLIEVEKLDQKTFGSVYMLFARPKSILENPDSNLF